MSTQRVTADKELTKAQIPPLPRHGLIQGTGVNVRGINRIHDPHLQKRLHNAQSNESYSQKRFVELSQIENVFNEIDRDGLNNILNNFYNSFRELSNQPIMKPFAL